MREFSGVELVFEHRAGSSYARNAGIAAARGEFIAMVDDDMRVSAQWLDQLLEPFARADVMGHWPELVGEENAERTEPISFEDGVLTVRCSSTAWTQQMRILRAETTTRILARFPDCGLTSVRFIGPDLPSFNRGRRSVPGRGPRDTWG